MKKLRYGIGIRNLAFPLVMFGSVVSAAHAGGFLWLSSELSSPVKIHRYNIATGMIDLSVRPTDPDTGASLCDSHGVCNNLAIDGTFIYLGTDGSDLFAKADAITGVVTSVESYSPPVASADIFEGGAYNTVTGTLWRNMINNHLLETTTDGIVVAERVVSNAGFHLLGLEWIDQTLYSTVIHAKQFGIIGDPFGNPTFTQLSLTGLPTSHLWDGLAYDAEDDVLYLTTRLNNRTAFLWTVDLDAGAATLVVDLTTVGYPTGAVADAIGWINPGFCGDGTVAVTEECDDGNTIDSDGCSSICTQETGWRCIGQPTVCSPICGDGIVTGPRPCIPDLPAITQIIDSTGDGAGNALDGPSAIAVDSVGNGYVAGSRSDNAFKITPGGVVTQIIDAAGDGAGNALGRPLGIAVDSIGTVYMTGQGSNNAFKITPGGGITKIIDSSGDGGSNTLIQPVGIALDSDGNVYVAGFSSNNAFKITPGGVITQIIGAKGDGAGSTLSTPAGIAVDSDGNVYVTGFSSNNAFKITPGGAITQIIDSSGDGTGNTLERCRTIAVDTGGNVYVCGTTSNNAFKITPGGLITQIIDSSGDGGSNTLNQPVGIAVDSLGSAYVAGSVFSDNAFKITSGGVITQIIDSSGNGAGNTLEHTFGIAVDSVGVVYVTGASSNNAFKIQLCVDSIEECDDGNTADGDCCSSTCENEPAGSQTCGVGACEVTIDSCADGVPVVCTPGTPTAEVCDGLDNDCDGITDEGFLEIHAAKHSVGFGSSPGSTKEPFDPGIEVCAFDKSEGSCARVTCGGISHQHYECIALGTDTDGDSVLEVGPCEVVNCCTTDATTGACTIQLSPGDYIVISADATKTVLPDPLGVSASDLVCGEVKQKHLQQIIKADGKKVSAKTTRRTGSELLIIEPEFVLWDGTEQLYPFVFETVGDWSVTTSVVPPEGFVSDYDSLYADVTTEIETVQFTITEVGSDLVPTGTTFDVTHKGRREIIQSQVGIFLTPEYARGRGFNVAQLRAAGLIKERPSNQGQGKDHRR